MPLALAAETGSSSWPVRSIKTSRPGFCSTACGSRSTISTTSVSGSWRETRASLTQLSDNRSRRSASTSTSGIARSRWPSTRSYTLSSFIRSTPRTSTRCTSNPASAAKIANCRLASAGTPAKLATSHASAAAAPRMIARKMRCSCSSVNGDQRIARSSTEPVLRLALSTLRAVPLAAAARRTLRPLRLIVWLMPHPPPDPARPAHRQ